MMEILNHEIQSGVNCFRTIQLSKQDQEKWWRGREDGEVTVGMKAADDF